MSTPSGQKGENLIQTTELQGLQIDPKIQIENLRIGPRLLYKQINLETLQYNSLIQITINGDNIPQYKARESVKKNQKL